MKKLAALLAASVMSLALAGQDKNAKNAAPEVDYSKPFYEMLHVPKEVKKLSEKTLPRDATQEAFHQNYAAAERGSRLYSTMVNPGEKIKFTLRCLPITAIRINWNTPGADDPQIAEIKQAFLNQEKRNAPFIEFTNKLDREYMVSFFLAGNYDVAYTVTIDRKAGK
jgi:hypothetical protein